ncbi:hypothetical protein M1329_00390 [Candidatus Marsarchaeota archaeon]|jgi:small subunit ribosomal protein S24e|nr:hypothetical protein [Candidatus Marsarchaeota archaeon]MCL5100152.1 hypothetical protein [Candidatus Marsarchaeota archaeon]
MELRITEDKENKLIGRREVEFVIDGEVSTPPTSEVAKELCKKLNLNPDNTIVTSIRQQFGLRRAVCTAHSYSDKRAMERYERRHIAARATKRSSKGAKNAAEEAPSQEPKPEKEAKPVKQEHKGKHEAKEGQAEHQAPQASDA